jgi:putative DNA primase/helicase
MTMLATEWEKIECHVNTDAPVIASKETDDEFVRGLAALPPLEYDRRREGAAKQLGCRTSTLDVQVEARRQKSSEELQGRAMELPDVELWPEPVNGADVLNEIAKTFSAYVLLPDRTADVLALWCAHAHGFRAFQCSPRLHISSPEKTVARQLYAMWFRFSSPVRCWRRI